MQHTGNTKIINLFAGPGAGKSTTAHGIMHTLKREGVNCEYVHEIAKLLTWEKRFDELAIQEYVFGKQLKLIETLIGKVDYIVSDSPLLLSAVYGEKLGLPWYNHVADKFRSFDNMNYFIYRSTTRPYQPKGRNQNLNEAKQLDSDILHILDIEQIPFEHVDFVDAVTVICNDVFSYSRG